ncbi:MAG: transglycosylase SLT domain-containing protein [Thermomicrobiales bacterium]|nr:transglycosylase SLT domain-containing protein [Thermomicrobiales bacterium]
MAGTGLPLPKTGDARTQPITVIDADRYSAAKAWGDIAAAGARLASAGADIGQIAAAAEKKDKHQAEVGYLADQEIEIRRMRTDLRDKHAGDPAAFDAAWKGFTDGKLAGAEPWAVTHVKRLLGSEGNSAYGAILAERRARDHSLDVQRLDTLVKQADGDVLGAAMAGTLNSPDGQTKLMKFRNVVDSAVTSGLMSREKADFLVEDMAGRAQSELAARDGVEVYRAQGYEAAVAHLRGSILENEKLSLSQARRQQAFNRGVSAVNIAAKEDRAERAEIVQMARDLRARITANQDVDAGEVRDLLGALQRTGAAAEHARLAKEYGVAQATAAYRSGALSIGQFGAQMATMRGEVNPALQMTITMAAHARGLDPAYLLAAAHRESRFDPNARAQSSSATGLFQFIDQTWLAQFRKDGAAAGHADLARQVQFEGRRYFVDDEATRNRILDLRRDPVTASRMMAALTADNRDRLRAALGRDPSHGELYAAHFLGAEGAADLLRAGPGQSAAALFPAAAAANRSIFYARDGSARTVADVVANLTGTALPSGDAGNMPLGEITMGAQRVFVEQAQKAWPAFKEMVGRGRTPDAEDFASMHYAAKLSGNAAWVKEVNSYAAAALLGRQGETMSESQRTTALDNLFKTFEKAGWTVESERVYESVAKQYERQAREVRDDPIGFGIRTGQFRPPAPLDLSSPATAMAGLEERLTIARSVAAGQETAPGVPFRAGDRQRLAGAIRGGSPAETGAAVGVLSSLPDDVLMPTLQSAEIKEALTGAARSSDPARFGAAMSALDQIYARAPGAFVGLFGEEAWHKLKTWQSNIRYLGPEEQAAALRRIEDPAARAQRERNEAEGRKLAREKPVADVVAGFDQSWGVTPGVIARNVTGSQPVAPTDPATRDALMGDYETVFARRYAETLDKDKAHEQTVELMKTRWSRSEVNGGRLMFRPPEAHYQMVGGDHKWMRAQIEAELTARFGPQQETAVAPLVTPFVPSFGASARRNWDYTIVPDRETDADAAAGRPPRYQVVVTNHRTGRSDAVKDDAGRVLRYGWDAGPAQEREAERFARDRAAIFGAADSLSITAP